MQAYCARTTHSLLTHCKIRILGVAAFKVTLIAARVLIVPTFPTPNMAKK